MRQSKLEYLMNIAENVSKRSHDSQTQVGSVLVSNKTGAILATGYNGFIRGANDLNLPTTRPAKYPYILHSEINLVLNCARHGISMEDCTIICTHSPCQFCMRNLYQAGITKVIVKTKYNDFESLKDLDDLSIDENIVDGFIELTYRIKQ